LLLDRTATFGRGVCTSEDEFGRGVRTRGEDEDEDEERDDEEVDTWD
jgi:hypothetical protein